MDAIMDIDDKLYQLGYDLHWGCEVVLNRSKGHPGFHEIMDIESPLYRGYVVGLKREMGGDYLVRVLWFNCSLTVHWHPENLIKIKDRHAKKRPSFINRWLSKIISIKNRLYYRFKGENHD